MDIGPIVDLNKFMLEYKGKTVEQILSAAAPVGGKFDPKLLLSQLAMVSRFTEWSVYFHSGRLSGPVGLELIGGLTKVEYPTTLNKEPVAVSLVREVLKESPTTGVWHHLKGGDHFQSCVSENVQGKTVPFIQDSSWASPSTIASVSMYVSQTMYDALKTRTSGRTNALTSDGTPLKPVKDVVKTYVKEKTVDPKLAKKYAMKEVKAIKKGMKKGMKKVKAMKAMKKK